MADPLKTDRTIYAEPPPPALPAAGGTLVDPTFGTTILRVTDERDGVDCHNSYSYWPSLNRGNTKLLCFCDQQPTIFDFDPSSLKISNKRQALNYVASLGGALRTEDALWSGFDPDTIFVHAGPKIFAYRVSQNSYSLVKDFTGLLPAANLEQMSRSIDDRVFAFTMKKANFDVIGYAVWDSETDKATPFLTTKVNEVQVDKSGAYLYVTTNDQGATAIQQKVITVATGASVDLLDGAPDLAANHYDTGYGTVIGDDNWNNRINFRDLGNPHTFVDLFSYDKDWSQGHHYSFLLDGESYVLVSTYYVSGTSSGLFKNELFLVATDGSGNVRRICHHHSNLAGQYWNSPRADISRDGQFAVFTSNWGSTTRRDVFVVRIPPLSAALPSSIIGTALRGIAESYDDGASRKLIVKRLLSVANQIVDEL